MTPWERITGAVIVGLFAASMMGHAMRIATSDAPDSAQQEIDSIRFAIAEDILAVGYPEQGLVQALAAYPDAVQAVAEQR